MHSYNDKWYALVAGKANSHAVTIIDVTNPNSPVEKAYIKETTERSDTLLREVNNVNTYKQTISGNERHFASVVHTMNIVEGMVAYRYLKWYF